MAFPKKPNKFSVYLQMFEYLKHSSHFRQTSTTVYRDLDVILLCLIHFYYQLLLCSRVLEQLKEKKIKFQILTNMDPLCYYWTSRAAAIRINPSENSPHRVKCHKIVMIYQEFAGITTLNTHSLRLLLSTTSVA